MQKKKTIKTRETQRNSQFPIVGIIDHQLVLSEATQPPHANLPIDHFFRSLSEDLGEKAICIILSSTGSDGTLGLKAIKGAGGMTMVQEESQAKYDGMPRSAIDTGFVDYILPVEKMPQELIKYVQHPYIEGVKKIEDSEGQSQTYLAKIFVLIRSKTGHDFSNYKQNTIRRRIERRMAMRQVDNISEYMKYIQQTPSEVNTLFKDLLITVTNFFRDPEAFEILKKKHSVAFLKTNIRIPHCVSGFPGAPPARKHIQLPCCWSNSWRNRTSI
ncbi:hypothetical protein JXJ21_00770 [candidate division KSB1 bacterium]|nr:hypothetical protein [candidate division KSB1 bacterium]